jgi:cyclohexanone monooxygenase
VSDRGTGTDVDVDVVVVGAGFSGLYMLYRLRRQGMTARVLESADDVGGTWYWNRYPGARCDVPSIEYSYGFSDELQQTWRWSEAMSEQPEILAYLQHVADRFDLRRDISFSTPVESAVYEEESGTWAVTTTTGERITCRFCVMATGCLSVPLEPDIPGLGEFGGTLAYTSRYPHEGIDFSGRRVAIVGTGSSGVQSIPVVAAQAAHLTVFQRTAVFTLPVGNLPLTDEADRRAKARYDEIRAKQRVSMAGFSSVGLPDGANTGLGQLGFGTATDKILDATPEERQARIEERGLGAIYSWADVLIDPEANEVACELYRDHVRRVVHDPVMAEALCPTGYPIGCKRQVLDTGYYEAFNRDNVDLVDLRRTPIETVTPTGIRTAEAHVEVDVLILATGFDAMTGALGRIDIRGTGGQRLQDKWHAGPRAYLGIQSVGFPNLFMITAPGSPSVLSNMTVSIEQHVDWVADCLAHMAECGHRTIEPVEAAEDAWIDRVNGTAKKTMYVKPSCNSWYLGANVPGKPRIFMPFVGGVGEYRRTCDEIVAAGYEGFVFGTPAPV